MAGRTPHSLGLRQLEASAGKEGCVCMGGCQSSAGKVAQGAKNFLKGAFCFYNECISVHKSWPVNPQRCRGAVWMRLPILVGKLRDL